MRCDICNKVNDCHTGQFYYGYIKDIKKHENERDYITYKEKITTTITSYEFLGSYKTFFCNSCVNKFAKNTIILGLFFIIFPILLLTIFFSLLYITDSYYSLESNPIIIGLFILLAIITCFFLILGPIYIIGSIFIILKKKGSYFNNFIDSKAIKINKDYITNKIKIPPKKVLKYWTRKGYILLRARMSSQ